jgi:hypothetical protein
VLAPSRRPLRPVAKRIMRRGVACLLASGDAFPDSGRRSGRLRCLSAILLLATLVSCAGPAPEPTGEVAVVEPDAVCRIGHNGGPASADRGIGGTGAPPKAQVADRGIGGTGIVGVVTGFASICVDGVEVRLDRTVPVSINGTAATAAQLRVGQLVVIEATRPVTIPESGAQARSVSVRYEVSGPIEAVNPSSGAVAVAGQQVMVLPTTWVAGRFGVGNWVTVSGLRQADGTIIASRLDPARTGALAVRGQITREGDASRIGGLVLHEPALATVKSGTFVSVAGRYRNGAVEVTSIDADPLLEDPTRYFGISTDQMVVQAFVRVDRETVWLSNGLRFRAGSGVQGKGSDYRNAIVRLQRAADGSFTATELRYTSYRARAKDGPVKAIGHRTGDLVLPPNAPPGPPPDDGIAPSPSPVASPPGDVPTSNAAPSQEEPSADAGVAGLAPTVPSAAIPAVEIAADGFRHGR